MHNAAILSDTNSTAHGVEDRFEHLRHSIAHAAHLLPSQGPIVVFVHHNTLHAFEHIPFEEAVLKGAETFDCEPYLTENRYREELNRGRIQQQDLSAVIIEDLGDSADQFVGCGSTRYLVRLLMLKYPVRTGPDAELRWLIAESDAMHHFRAETLLPIRQQMIQETRQWVMRDLRDTNSFSDPRIRGAIENLFNRFDRTNIETWSDATWESFTLHLLWRVCRHGVHSVPASHVVIPHFVRHRDALFSHAGLDSDRLVHEVLIRFCAAFLDQGLAHWTLPNRDDGLFRCFLAYYRSSWPVERWLRRLPEVIAEIDQKNMGPLECIQESLDILGVAESEQEEFVVKTLLALRGWAGMIWQMESNAEWTVHPAPKNSLIEYLAIRLLLERLALKSMLPEAFNEDVPLAELRNKVRRLKHHAPTASVDQRAFQVFQLAQVMGWHPPSLHRLPREAWVQMIHEIESFSTLERRRLFHLAYERRYRNQTLDALALHGRRIHSDHASAVKANGSVKASPAYQVVCCLDEREESFRRHLEEIDPECETLGAAGFFGVAMYYHGAAEAHFKPLCPIVVKPQHFVVEEPVYTFEESSKLVTRARQAWGRASHSVHIGSRTFVGGLLTAFFGSLATFPLVTRVLFPRVTAQIRSAFGRMVNTPVTRLRLERIEPTPGPSLPQVGYTVDEMADIVEGMLRAMGMVHELSKLILFLGHGSSSFNNPHAAAYDCGACGGNRGGPNARAFARMANDARVRRIIAGRGLSIPDHVYFIGGYHNTCDDSITYSDLDNLPESHRELFERAKRALLQARQRNAHERCRRFEAAPLDISRAAALRHVQGRAEDLSQTRPEYGHSTNAVTYIGRRKWTRGLFMDRRCFLTSYDPTTDDANGSILTRILQAVIPVCAGISLEYYFSRVDVGGYGCGTKLPHNIAALLGVMDGAASDLRTGLNWQMVEIHEPMRSLFILETTPEIVLGILERNPPLQQLVKNRWVQLATLNGATSTIHLFREGRFEPYSLESEELPVVRSSADWFRGWRDHLGYSSIVAEPPRSALAGPEET